MEARSSSCPPPGEEEPRRATESGLRGECRGGAHSGPSRGVHGGPSPDDDVEDGRREKKKTEPFREGPRDETGEGGEGDVYVFNHDVVARGSPGFIGALRYTTSQGEPPGDSHYRVFLTCVLSEDRESCAVHSEGSNPAGCKFFRYE